MKPAPFDYIRPEGCEELCSLLAEYADDAAILAGGQSLMPLLNLRQRRPKLLIDISGCHELDAMSGNDQAFVIGANVTQRQLEFAPMLRRDLPLLSLALPHIGNPQVRNRGTFCGSLAHAHPSAELPLCLLALDGTVELQSQRGHRRLAAADFFLGAFSTARQADEFVRSATLPRAAVETACAFDEVALRSSGQAIIACAAVAKQQSLRLAIAGASPRPHLRDLPISSAADLPGTLAGLAQEIAPVDDALASAAYRRHLIVHIGTAVLQAALHTLRGLPSTANESQGVCR